MPVMDGVEATRRLREMPQFADTPLIALTASVDHDSEERHIAAGMTAQLNKPLRSSELFAALRPYLAGRPETRQGSDDGESGKE